jgi:hypothetical protein
MKLLRAAHDTPRERGSFSMEKRKWIRKQEPVIAPGMDDHKELEQPATKEEIRRGDYTRVTTLAWDEVDKS